MAKDDDWTDLLREVVADTATAAPTRDMGPDARRAAAGMPRMGGTAAAPPTPPVSVPTGPLSQAWMQKQLTPSPPGSFPPGEMDDPGVQMIASGLTGYGAGKLIPAAAAGAPAAMKALSRVASGATEGAVASKTQGGSAGVGAVVGGGLGAFGAAGANRPARLDTDLYREIGRAAGQKEQGKLVELGADQIVKTAKDFGIADAKGWTARAAASGAAKRQVGEQIGGAFKTLDAAGAQRPTTSVIQALETLKGELGRTTEGQKLAEIVTAKQEALRKLYPQSIPASALNKEIGDLQAIGYSGAAAGQLSPTAAKRVARMSAKAMDKELDTALAGARKDPALRAAVESLDQLNPTYRSLIAIDTIATRQAAKEPFKKTLGEQFAAAPGRTTMKLATGAATAPLRGARTAVEVLGGTGQTPGGPGTAAAGVTRPERKVAPAVVPIVTSLQSGGADLDKHVEAAVFGQ